MEEWRPIKLYEELYEVSDHGNVRSKITGTIRVLSTHYKGHLFLYLNRDANRKKFFVHRLVAIAFIPNLEEKEVVNHKDENKKNNHVSNLEWLTGKENTQYSLPSRIKRMKERKVHMHSGFGTTGCDCE